MARTGCRMACILLFLFLTGCAGPDADSSLPATPPATAAPSPSPTPADTPRSSSPETTTAQFLIDQVGEGYFRDHYTLEHEEVVGTGLVKTAYGYTYEPYVHDYPFTLLFDLQKQALSDQEVSVVLLEPQTFGIGPEEAKALALANGLDPSGGAYEVNLLFGPVTHNRFAWEVINPEASPTEETPKPIFRVVLDVEEGQVIVVEEVGPMKGHGSPAGND